MWGEKDSNLRSRKTTDLQSVPVGRFGIPPAGGNILMNSPGILTIFFNVPSILGVQN